jgi:hypothetical protein
MFSFPSSAMPYLEEIEEDDDLGTAVAKADKAATILTSSVNTMTAEEAEAAERVIVAGHAKVHEVLAGPAHGDVLASLAAIRRDIMRLRVQQRRDLAESRTQLRRGVVELRTQLRRDIARMRIQQRAHAVEWRNSFDALNQRIDAIVEGLGRTHEAGQRRGRGRGRPRVCT